MIAPPAKPERRLTLPEQVDQLRPALPPRKARAAVERAFKLKELLHSPKFALAYDDAAIDWKTGRVTLTRGERRPFMPNALADDFERHFADTLAGATTGPVLAAAPTRRRSPTPQDTTAFSRWWNEQRSKRTSPPTRQDAEQFARERGLSRDWARAQIREIPSAQRRVAGGQKSQGRE